MSEYIGLSMVCLVIGGLVGTAIERAVWVWRTDHLNICEHATPRCHQCNLRVARRKEQNQ